MRNGIQMQLYKINDFERKYLRSYLNEHEIIGCDVKNRSLKSNVTISCCANVFIPFTDSLI